MRILRDKGIGISEDMDRPLRPGSVVFVRTPDGVTHRDYVTHAWTDRPLKEVLVKMASTPALTRIASTGTEPSQAGKINRASHRSSGEPLREIAVASASTTKAIPA